MMYSIIFLCLLIKDFHIVHSQSSPCSQDYEPDYSWWNYVYAGNTRHGCDLDYTYDYQLPFDLDSHVGYENLGYTFDNPLTNMNTLCPKIHKCSEIKDVPFSDCTSTDDCKRSEVCCQNPCTDKKQCLLKINKNIKDNVYDHILKCPSKVSCEVLSLEDKDGKIEECADNSECKRKDVCCKLQCTDLPDQICVKGVLEYPYPFNTFY